MVVKDLSCPLSRVYVPPQQFQDIWWTLQHQHLSLFPLVLWLRRCWGPAWRGLKTKSAPRQDLNALHHYPCVVHCITVYGDYLAELWTLASLCTSFQSDHWVVVLHWLVEWMMIWVWIQHADELLHLFAADVSRHQSMCMATDLNVLSRIQQPFIQPLCVNVWSEQNTNACICNVPNPSMTNMVATLHAFCTEY